MASKYLLLFAFFNVALSGTFYSAEIGGPGGNPFTQAFQAGDRITSMTFYQAGPGLSYRVGQIVVCYSVSGCATYGVCYGGTVSTTSITFDADESVQSVDLRSDLPGVNYFGSFITWIRVTTTKGRVVASGNAFGSGSATYSVPAGATFDGFIGRSGCWIDAWGIIYKTPDQICGDGIIQPGEDCDGGACCSTSCKFKAATVVCRNAVASCDAPENCTGASADCPADAYLPVGTPCGEFFGACDVQLLKSCPGDAPVCHGPPSFPILSSVQSWTDFTVVSFDGYSCQGGTVEGRLAARNSFSMSGFSLGSKLTYATDSWKPYSLFSAGSGSWTDGSLYPDGNNADVAGPSAFAYVSGTFTAPDYLFNREIANITAADATTGFDNAKAYFTTIQNTLNALPYNAQSSVQYGDGLFINCNQLNDLYHVAVDGAVLSTINWITLSGCRFNARWVIDVTGTTDVTIKGQPFPAIVERVIYNVLGSGRTITGQTGVGGHILAPNNIYTQTTGVTYGLVIVGNVASARQNAKPNCANFIAVTLTTKLVKPVQIGDTTIFVADLTEFVVGDLLCINGDCRKITSITFADVDGDGALDHAATLDSAFTTSHTGDNILATTTVSNPSTAVRPETAAVPGTITSAPKGSVGQLIASLLMIASLILVIA